MPAVGRIESAKDESARYRVAAEEALDQLQWCINYLRSIRKTRIADVLAKNHRTIRDRLRQIDG
jgi:hypothetical protein